MQGTTFSNANSLPFLFISKETAEGWCAFLMREGQAYNDTEISFKTIWDGSGSFNLTKIHGDFLFARQQPKNLGDAYLRQLRAVLKNLVRTHHNLTITWLTEPDEEPSEKNVLVVPLFEQSANNFKVVREENIAWGEIAELNFTKDATAQKEIKGQYSAILFPIPSTTPNLRPVMFGLKTGSQPINITRQSRQIPTDSFVSIPLSGDSRGCIRFEMDLLEDEDLMAFDFGQKFSFPKNGNGQLESLHFPFLREVRSNRLVRMQASIDPANLLNKKSIPARFNPARTYLAFTGKTRNKNFPHTEEDTIFESWYRTHNGYRIKLRPNLINLHSEAAANTFFAGRNSARLVWCEKQTGSGEWYLTPAGEFYLELNETDLDKAVVNGQAHLLAGLSGTETIGFKPADTGHEGDRLRFQPYQPAFAPIFSIDEGKGEQAAPGPLLTNKTQTSWANVVTSNGTPVIYAVEPEGASLYTRDHGIKSDGQNSNNGVLGFFELAVKMPQDEDFAIPLVPYEGVKVTLGETLAKFESQIISTARKTGVSKKHPPALIRNGTNVEMVITSTTPQGTIAKLKPDGRWEEMILAQNTVGNTRQNYLNFTESETETSPPEFKAGFINLKTALKDAFQTNQHFLVATQNENLGRLFTKLTETEQIAGLTDEAIFNNKMFIREWPFLINTGSNGAGDDYRNVLIFKFCKGSLKDRLKDPNIWTRPGDYNQTDELPAISTWLQDYIAAAEAQSSPYFDHFKKIVNDKNWNGILALKLDLTAENFPDSLKGLLGGIDTSRLNIHHFGIEINHVKAAGGIKLEENSSLFGLISYFDEAYLAQISAPGANPDLPVPPADGTFDFKVLSLQVLFENTDIKDFACKVQVTMNELLQDNVRHVSIQDVTDKSTANSLILNGTYEEHEGEMVYIFKQTKSNKFHLDSNILHFMEIERAYFDTVSTKNNLIKSRFRFGGNINFEILKKTVREKNEFGEDVDKTVTLDLFSFGSEQGMEGFDIGKGLRFSNLYLDMKFDLAAPNARTFDMIVQDFKLNIENSYSREEGLFTKFPLSFQGFIFGTDKRLPSAYGYEPIEMPAIDIVEHGITGEWLGLKYKANLGSPGQMASSSAFDAELLLAWSPQGKEADTDYRLYFGMLLPGPAGNSKALSIQGVLKLGVGSISIDFGKKDKDTPGAYVLSLNVIGLRFINFPIFPPPSIPGIEDTMLNIFLFANSKQAVKKNIGWFMAYKMPEIPVFKGISIPFVALGQHVAFKSLDSVESVSDAVEKMKAAFFPSNGNELMVKFAYGSLEEEDEEKLELVFSDESNWLIAFELGLLALLPKEEDASDDTDKSNGSSSNLELPFDSFAIEVAVIFNDPEIYGLRLALGGAAMKVFDGLEFEILYKKVTDAIGVYKILFTLPDHFRKFEVGAAKLTLPVLGLDIYTNGDFKVDLGFPYELDFSRSFNIEVQAGPFPLTGSAGFYFGKLSGETALMLPPVREDSDGNPVGRFGTVIIFGFGFEIGFGKSIEKGVLSASFKITLVAVVEGVVAPFIPNNEVATTGNIEETNYYWIQGTIGLVGILEGKVDFVVISASVYVKVYALIQATFESYRPVPIILKAGVEVSVSIKILFARIRFSFSATIEAKIVVGTDRWLKAPWNKVPTATRMAMAMRGGTLAIPVIEYGKYTFTGSKQPLNLLLSLQPTVADNPTDGSAQLSYVALLMLDNSQFKQLSDGVFRWVVSSYKQSENPTLTLTDLEEIRDCLNDSGPGRTDIEKFLETYFTISIQGLTTEQPNLEATIFPMLPALQMNWSGNSTPVKFDSHNQVTESYLEAMKAFLQDFSLVEEDAAATDGAGKSLATLMFEDYFQLMAKHTVSEAILSMQNFSYELKAGHTLENIATGLGNQVSITAIAEQNKLHPLTAGSTFHELSISTGKDIATLADERKGTPGLFDATGDKFLGITTLSNLSTQALIDDLYRNNVSANLSGMVARYQLSGLRLPDLVTDTKHHGLFHLTGQQFSPTGNPFGVTLTRPDDQTWLTVGAEKALTMSQAVENLMDGFSDASFEFSLNAVAAIEKVEQRFNFRQFSSWTNSAAPASSLIWHFPDTLMHHLHSNAGAGSNLKVRYGVFNEAKQRLDYFGKSAEWGTMVNVTIKRKPGQGDDNLRYELIGTDEIGITLLERLLLSGEDIFGGNIQILFGTDNSNDKKSLQSVDIANLKTFITQANLSTETNPI